METPVNYQKITKFPIHSKMLGLRLEHSSLICITNQEQKAVQYIGHDNDSITGVIWPIFLNIQFIF